MLRIVLWLNGCVLCVNKTADVCTVVMMEGRECDNYSLLLQNVTSVLCLGNGSKELVFYMSWEYTFLYYLWTVATPTVFALLIVLGTVGNALVIRVITSQPAMRTATNYLLLNLACSDIAFLLVCGTTSAYNFVSSSWAIGNFVCKMTHYVMYVTNYTTVYTLVAVSFLRYLTVVCGSKTLHYRTRTNSIIIVACIWCIVMLVNIPTAVVARVKTYENYTYCGMEPSSIRPFYVTYFVFAYALPVVIIGYLYVLIISHLLRNRSENIQQSRQRNIRASKVVMGIVIAFGILWLPFHVQHLLANFGTLPKTVIYELFRVLWQALTYANSCVNPLIYNFTSRDFQKGFRELFACSTFMSRLMGVRRRSSRRGILDSEHTTIGLNCQRKPLFFDLENKEEQ